MSRLRSKSESKSYVMASMNPDPDSWVLDWVMPYLDEQGYFNEDMAGVLNYFYTIEGKPVFSQDPEVLKTNFPHKYKLYNPTEKRYEYVEPKSFTFLGSTLFDNEILMRSNPNYLAELNSLPDVERARLLYGNWFAREQGSNYFNRNLLVRLREAPSGVSARGWDKASTEPSDKERYPDFTSSIKMIRTQEGRFCIVGDYCPENQEDDGVYKGRFRKPPSQRDKIIIDQALYDGKECKVILPVDVGQAGKVQPLDAKVVTSLGYTDIGNLKKGSFILNPDGVRQKVIDIFPHKDWEFYRVTFNDGSSCEVGKEHLWTCWRGDKRTTAGLKRKELHGDNPFSLWSPYAEVISTEGMSEWMRNGFNPLIPVSKPLEHSFPPSKLLVDPYILGVLIGDGCITCSHNNGLRFSTMDQEIPQYFTDNGFEVSPDGDYGWFFIRNQKYKDLYSGLEKYDLIGKNSATKSIPHNYLISSLAVRVELLKGLMDTDGYVCEKGKYEYVTVSKELSNTLTRLIQSLGGWCKVSLREPKEGTNESLAYRHYIRLPNEINPFKLPRKVNRFIPSVGRMFRRVISIVPSRKADGVCIMVNNPNHLYMTNEYIVTHNSEYQSHARQIIAKGITVRPDPMPTNKSKVTKYSPFSSALGAGLIDIVESSFPDKATLDLFLKENEAFNGERSSAHRKDDWPDCLATTFNYLNEQEQIPNIVVVDMSRTNPFKI